MELVTPMVNASSSSTLYRTTDRATGYPCVLARVIKGVADLTQGEYEFSLLTLVEFVEK